MKIDRVKVNYGRTVNMGNFESMRIDVEFSATVEPTEKPEIVAENLRTMAKLEVSRMVQKKNRRDEKEYY